VVIANAGRETITRNNQIIENKPLSLD